MDNKGIKEEWKKYYIALEIIRESGKTNMYGATPYLEEIYPETKERVSGGNRLSHKILANWMNNYDELCDIYGWRK